MAQEKLNASLIIANVCKAAGVSEETFNDKTAEAAELRSIAVRWMYDYGMSEREIAKQLGWSQQRVHERKNCPKFSRRIKAITDVFEELMLIGYPDN